MKKYLTIFFGLFLLCMSGSIALASEVSGSLSTGIDAGMSGVVITAPTADPVANTYSSARSVSLSASGATSIHYTTDGTTPTCTTGATYSEAISVGSSLTIKAISCYPNSNASDVASFAYTINIAPVTSGGGGGGGGGGWYPMPTTTTPVATSTPTTTILTTGGGTSGNQTLLSSQQQLLLLLIAQLKALLAQAQAQGIPLPVGSEVFLSGGGSTQPYFFTRNLSMGMTGEDVRALQAYLNKHGFQVAVSGPGSLGNETTRFGSGTKTALMNFQKSISVAPIGIFGPQTRAYVNAHP